MGSLTALFLLQIIFKLLPNAYSREALLLSEDTVQPRVAYGKPVTIEEYPFYASMFYCGAAIISDRWVVTAAHCVDRNIHTNTHYGILSVSGVDLMTSEIVLYDHVVFHPEYYMVNTYYVNDIALLRLVKPLVFDDKVQPINLPADSNKNYNRLSFSDDSYEYNYEYKDYSEESWEDDMWRRSGEYSYENKNNHVDNNDSDGHPDNYSVDHKDNNDEATHNDDHTEGLSDENWDNSDYSAFYDDEESIGFNSEEGVDPTHVLVSVGQDHTGEHISTIDINLSSASACLEHFEPHLFRRKPHLVSILDKTTFCGDRVEDWPGAGEADIGSPLVKNGTLVGIHSMIYYHPDVPHTPFHSRIGYFVKVSSYVPWIKFVTGL